MSNNDLAKVWKGLSLALLFYVLNTWLSSQGGQPVFSVKLLHGGREGGAVLAIIVGGILLSIASVIGHAFASRNINLPWTQRIPIVWIDGVEHTIKSSFWLCFHSFRWPRWFIFVELSLVHHCVMLLRGEAFRLACFLCYPARLRMIDTGLVPMQLRAVRVE
jgi:hypothetical protein